MYNSYPNYPNYPNQNLSQPYMDRLNQMQTQRVTEVNGINGANAYSIPPNSSVILLDSNLPIVYIKTSDGAGYATTKAYDITPHEEKNINLESIETRLSKLEAKINEQSSEPKSKSKSAEK